MVHGRVAGRFVPQGWTDGVVDAEPGGGSKRSATVSVYRDMGGITPRALLAGEFTPAAEKVLCVRVPRSGVLLERPSHDCPDLFGDRLATGLPDEFSEAVTHSLIASGSTMKLSGYLEVVGAGYDEVNSSSLVFEIAADALKYVLMSQAQE